MAGQQILINDQMDSPLKKDHVLLSTRAAFVAGRIHYIKLKGAPAPLKVSHFCLLLTRREVIH